MNIQTVMYYEGRDIRELSPDELVALVMDLHRENEGLKASAAAKSASRVRELAAVGQQVAQGLR